MQIPRHTKIYSIKKTGVWLLMPSEELTLHYIIVGNVQGRHVLKAYINYIESDGKKLEQSSGALQIEVKPRDVSWMLVRPIMLGALLLIGVYGLRRLMKKK